MPNESRDCNWKKTVETIWPCYHFSRCWFSTSSKGTNVFFSFIDGWEKINLRFALNEFLSRKSHLVLENLIVLTMDEQTKKNSFRTFFSPSNTSDDLKKHWRFCYYLKKKENFIRIKLEKNIFFTDWNNDLYQ